MLFQEKNGGTIAAASTNAAMKTAAGQRYAETSGFCCRWNAARSAADDVEEEGISWTYPMDFNPCMLHETSQYQQGHGIEDEIKRTSILQYFVLSHPADLLAHLPAKV